MGTPKNTFLYLILLCLSLGLSFCMVERLCVLRKKNTVGVVISSTIFIYVLIFIVLEILEFGYGFRVWDQTERTVRCYEWFEYYLNNENGSYDKESRFDYSESLFLGNHDLPIQEATQQKYRYIFSSLGLEPGMTLLDCGCGIGTWMDYCRQRGVNVIGLTLSDEQVKVGRAKGLDIQCQDYRVENPDFYDKFDCITVLGSSEHVCSSYDMSTAQDRCFSTQKHMYAVLQKYLHPNGKIFITTLVNNFHGQYTLYDYVQCYIIERHYGGYYISENNLRQVLEKNHFKILSVQDMTRDYHWTSVVAPEHFGHWYVHWHKKPFDKILFFCRGLVVDPFLLHHWLYYACDTWMWQFGGYHKTPLTDDQIQEAPAQLKYILVQKM